MKPWRRHWLLRLLDLIRDAVDGPQARVLRVSPERIRRIQKRHAQLAFRHPFTRPPARHRLPRGAEDRGFQ